MEPRWVVKRAACCMKHVGLNVAADPLFTISYHGVEAGVVICVADDPGMFSSQNEQDSRHYAIAAKIPMLEPSDSPKRWTLRRRPSASRRNTIPPSFCGCVPASPIPRALWKWEPREEVPAKEYVKDTQRVMMTTNS